MRDFEPKPLSSPQVLELVKGSTRRTISLTGLSLEGDAEALERLRAEKRVYLDYLGQFQRAVLERRIF